MKCTDCHDTGLIEHGGDGPRTGWLTCDCPAGVLPAAHLLAHPRVQCDYIVARLREREPHKYAKRDIEWLREYHRLLRMFYADEHTDSLVRDLARFLARS